MEKFELESDIMAAWSTKEDLELIIETMFEGEKPLTEDEQMNLLAGLVSLHDARCKRLFGTYENLISQL